MIAGGVAADPAGDDPARAISVDVYPAPENPNPVPVMPEFLCEPEAEPLSAVEAQLAEMLRTVWLERRPNWVDPGWCQYPLSAMAREMTTKEAGPDLIKLLAAQPLGRCDAHGGLQPGTSDQSRASDTATGRPCECLLVVLAAWEACGAWQSAQATEQLVAVMGSHPVHVPSPQAAAVGLGALRDPAIEEIAIVWRSSPSSVRNRLGNARMLTDHDKMLKLVRHGAFPLWVLKRITSLLIPLPSDIGQLISNTLADRIRMRLRCGRAPWTTSQLIRLAKRMVLELSPDDAERARKSANSFRYVAASSGDNGMALIEALLPEVTVKEIMGHLTRTSQGLAAVGRNRDQMRADVFADLLIPGAFRTVSDLASSHDATTPPSSGPVPFDPAPSQENNPAAISNSTPPLGETVSDSPDLPTVTGQPRDTFSVGGEPPGLPLKPRGTPPVDTPADALTPDLPESGSSRSVTPNQLGTPVTADDYPDLPTVTG
ncbi:MAG: hypothetical protein K0U64_01515, partial [Actinomycetia bacterium]|nr:hypothetical protein [Actinomycetes bacterium]